MCSPRKIKTPPQFFDPSAYKNPSETHSAYQLAGAAFLKTYTSETLLSKTSLRAQTPNKPILQAHRFLFAFLAPDSCLNFHLKSLPWVGPSYADQNQLTNSEPSVTNYLKDQNIFLKKFVEVLQNPQQKISVRKMRRLLYFFEDFSEEFEWLEDHKIEKFLVWALCQFVKVTLVYLSHVFEGQRGEGFGSSIRVIRKGLGGETVGAEIGLGGSPLSAEGGLGGSPMNPKKGLAKSQFGPKGCPCHPEKEVGKG